LPISLETITWIRFTVFVNFLTGAEEKSREAVGDM
jgi:hypothetical protein